MHGSPLISIFSHLIKTGQRPRELHFLYASKASSELDAQRILFLPRLMDLVGIEGNPQVTLSLYLTGTGEEGMIEYGRLPNRTFARRIGEADLSEAFNGFKKSVFGPEHDRSGTVAYVCGPPRFTDELVALAQKQIGNMFLSSTLWLRCPIDKMTQYGEMPVVPTQQDHESRYRGCNEYHASHETAWLAITLPGSASFHSSQDWTRTVLQIMCILSALILTDYSAMFPRIAFGFGSHEIAPGKRRFRRGSCNDESELLETSDPYICPHDRIQILASHWSTIHSKNIGAMGKVLHAGKTAFITGAGGGLGRAIAEHFLEEGANVVVCDVNGDLVTEFRTIVSHAYPDRTLVLEADITSEAALDELFARAEARFGGLDYVVNSAGIMDRMDPAGDVTKALWDRVMAVNLTAPMMITQRAVKAWVGAGKKGAIVNISSIAGVCGYAAAGRRHEDEHCERIRRRVEHGRPQPFSEDLSTIALRGEQGGQARVISVQRRSRDCQRSRFDCGWRMDIWRVDVVELEAQLITRAKSEWKVLPPADTPERHVAASVQKDLNVRLRTCARKNRCEIALSGRRRKLTGFIDSPNQLPSLGAALIRIWFRALPLVATLEHVRGGDNNASGSPGHTYARQSMPVHENLEDEAGTMAGKASSISRSSTVGTIGGDLSRSGA
nr:sorbitol dehydrogenase [Quercus suber]